MNPIAQNFNQLNASVSFRLQAAANGNISVGYTARDPENFTKQDGFTAEVFAENELGYNLGRFSAALRNMKEADLGPSQDPAQGPLRFQDQNPRKGRVELSQERNFLPRNSTGLFSGEMTYRVGPELTNPAATMLNLGGVEEFGGTCINHEVDGSFISRMDLIANSPERIAIRFGESLSTTGRNLSHTLQIGPGGEILAVE